MKDFIENVQKSIYAPEYYRGILSRPKSFSFKYFFGLALALSLGLTVLISIPIIIKVPQFLRDSAAGTIAYFPEELELRVTNGIVSSNVTEPYHLPYPAFLKEEAIPLPAGSLITIDTATDFSLEHFSTQGTLLWVGKDFVAYSNDKGAVEIQRFDSRMNYVMNKTTVRNFVAQMTPYFWIVPPAIFIIMFLAFLMMNIAQLAYLLIASVIIYAMLRYLKKNVSYWGAYQIGLHALTLPILLNAVLLLFSFQLTQLPFMQTLILIAIVYVNFREDDAVAQTTLEEGKNAQEVILEK